jgi:hypothetical protein
MVVFPIFKHDLVGRPIRSAHPCHRGPAFEPQFPSTVTPARDILLLLAWESPPSFRYQLTCSLPNASSRENTWMCRKEARS